MITVKKILVPIDFSAPSGGALDWAKSLAMKAKSELILFHSIEWSHEIRKRVEAGRFKNKADYEPHVKREIAANLESWSHKCRRGKLSVSTELSEGKPASEIIRATKHFDIDLIVMGTHGWTNSANVLIGSVAERVARKASCPVLTIKAASFKYKPI